MSLGRVSRTGFVFGTRNLIMERKPEYSVPLKQLVQKGISVLSVD